MQGAWQVCGFETPFSYMHHIQEVSQLLLSKSGGKANMKRPSINHQISNAIVGFSLLLSRPVSLTIHLLDFKLYSKRALLL